MKVIMESMGGTRIPVEIGDSAGTVKELKEKIEKALFIPKAKQILYLNGNLLCNDDAHLIDVKHGSVIKFKVAGVHPKPEAEITNRHLALSPSETIAVKERTPADYRRLPVVSTSPRARKRSRLSVAASSSPTPVAVDADKIIGLDLQCRWKSVMPAPVEVRRSDTVRELRRRLEAMKFKVPGNRDYIFYHKNSSLDEDRSFASQNVADGDIILIIYKNWLF